MKKRFAKNVLINVNRSFFLYSLLLTITIVLVLFRLIFNHHDAELANLTENIQSEFININNSMRIEFFNYMNENYLFQLEYIDIIYNIDKENITFKSSNDYQNFYFDQLDKSPILKINNNYLFNINYTYYDGDLYLYGIDLRNMIEYLNTSIDIFRFFLVIETDHGLLIPNKITFSNTINNILLSDSNNIFLDGEFYRRNIIKYNKMKFHILIYASILRNIVYQSLFIFVFFIFLSFLIMTINSIKLNNLILKPTTSIMSGIKNIKEKKSNKIYYEDDDEFKEIVDELNSLYYKLEMTIKNIEKSEKEAIKSSNFKSHMIKLISHEIRTPLHSLIGYTNHLKSKTQNKEELFIINNIKNVSNDLLKKLERIFDRSKLEFETEDVKFNFFPCKLKNLIYETASKYETLSNKKHINFEFNLEDINNLKEDLVLLDISKLKIIINEILENAVKFTNSGKISFGVKILDQNIIFLINDTGKGIPSSDLYEIFNPFFQSENYLNREKEGLGIGLSLAKHYTELLSGKLNVDSLDVGTSVKIELPLILTKNKIKYFSLDFDFFKEYNFELQKNVDLSFIDKVKKDLNFYYDNINKVLDNMNELSKKQIIDYLLEMKNYSQNNNYNNLFKLFNIFIFNYNNDLYEITVYSLKMLLEKIDMKITHINIQF